MGIADPLPVNIKVPSLKAVFTDEEIAEASKAVEEILRSGRLTLGKYTERFEQVAADKFGRKYAIGVSCGTAALEIILRYLDVKGKRVILPTNTNFATAAAPLYAGAEVVLADGGLYLNVDDLQGLLMKETISTLIVVHIGGYVTDQIDLIKQLCEVNNVYLLEDAAHAHGAIINHAMAGSLGHAAAFSLFPTKVITTGEGGIITTDDEELYQAAKIFRDQGIDPKSHLHIKMGNSWRMSEIEAALGCIQLASLESNVQHRRAGIKLYEELLADVEGIKMAKYGENVLPSGYKCIAVLDETVSQTHLQSKLKDAYGILIGRKVYELPLHRQPVFEHLQGNRMFPVADEFCQRHICLPLWRTISADEIEYVVAGIKAVISESRQMTK